MKCIVQHISHVDGVARGAVVARTHAGRERNIDLIAEKAFFRSYLLAAAPSFRSYFFNSSAGSAKNVNTLSGWF